MSNGLLVVQLNPNPISDGLLVVHQSQTIHRQPTQSKSNLRYALGIKPIPNQISDGLALKVVGGRDEVDPLQAPLALVHVQRAVRQLLLGAHVAANYRKFQSSSYDSYLNPRHPN